RAKLGTIQTYEEKFNEINESIKKNEYQPAIYLEPKEEFHVLEMTRVSGEMKNFNSVNEMLDVFYSGKAERDRVKQQAKDLSRFIKNERNKNIRKLKKHKQTLKKAENAGSY